jgi:pilus assembly protein Flp/PilA
MPNQVFDYSPCPISSHLMETTPMNTAFSFLSTLRNLANREEGQDLIEYALVCALIALACVGTMPSIGTALNNIFSSVNAQL